MLYYAMSVYYVQGYIWVIIKEKSICLNRDAGSSLMIYRTIGVSQLFAYNWTKCMKN